MTYFCEEHSIQSKIGNRITDTLEIIAQRYIRQNPPLPFTFRSFHRGSFLHTSDGRYDLDAEVKYPSATNGDYMYASSMFWSPSTQDVEFSMNCSSPTKVFMNGELLYRATLASETDRRNKGRIIVHAKSGWNHVCIEMRKAASGFGCIFGSYWAKWFPIDFYCPYEERKGQGGWVYSELMDQPLAEDIISKLYEVAEERETGVSWYPNTEWQSEAEAMSPWERLFGFLPGRAAVAWTAFEPTADSFSKVEFNCDTAGPLQVWIDSELLFECDKPGAYSFQAELEPGDHHMLVRSICGNDTWRGSVVSSDVVWKQPHPVKGTNESWLYLGTFPKTLELQADTLLSLYQVISTDQNRKLYWQIDQPDTYVRPYLENALFAKWNYPLGVTLYGLLKAGRLLESQHIVDYATRHISECTQLFEYALWDREMYGYPTVNQQLIEMDMLDDVGSFGSVMLEAYQDKNDPSYKLVAHRIAHYIKNEQERTSGGAFYRRRGNEGTLWVDDLYMSTPFLTRYYRLSKDSSYIDDAVKQFLLFKQYLYMEEERIMSHVYDFHYETPTMIPWGRGNGWCLFSLSEVLEVLPEEHVERMALLEFFNELSEGYLSLQGKDGMWHQVLTHSDSYEESSCTAMFVYAFARGVRFGWYSSPKMYQEAANRGWNALTRRAIDEQGNIHGVCKGSSYSFTEEYYKKDLLWTTNDTHGIGIVMLAGVEIEMMRASAKGK